MLEGDQDNGNKQVCKEQQPELQDHDLLLLLLRVLNSFWLNARFNLKLEPHVQVEQHEPNGDEEREGAARLVGHREQGEQS